MKQVPSFVLMVAFLVMGFARTIQAQEREVVEIKKGEVVRVVGNNLFVRVEGEGVKRYVVPSDFKFNHQGKEISVRELREGMQLTGVRLRTTGTGEVVAEEDIDKVMAEIAEAPAARAEGGAAESAEAASESAEAAGESAEAESTEAPAAASGAESATTTEAADSSAESGGLSPVVIVGLLILALVLVVLAVKQLRKT
jgi:ribosomal protein L12E/L44/L45/RPP1/RPP2